MSKCPRPNSRYRPSKSLRPEALWAPSSPSGRGLFCSHVNSWFQASIDRHWSWQDNLGEHERLWISDHDEHGLWTYWSPDDVADTCQSNNACRGEVSEYWRACGVVTLLRDGWDSQVPRRSERKKRVGRPQSRGSSLYCSFLAGFSIAPGLPSIMSHRKQQACWFHRHEPVGPVY